MGDLDIVDEDLDVRGVGYQSGIVSDGSEGGGDGETAAKVGDLELGAEGELGEVREEKRPGTRCSWRRQRGKQEAQEWRESSDGAKRVRGPDQVERTGEYMAGMAMASSWKPSLERIGARRKAWCGSWGGGASDPMVDERTTGGGRDGKGGRGRGRSMSSHQGWLLARDGRTESERGEMKQWKVRVEIGAVVVAPVAESKGGDFGR